MENALMRAGVALRDYREARADWLTLVAAVEGWARADEDVSIALALGGPSSSAKAAQSAEKEARRGAVEAVARGKRAYALLYVALPDALRSLVAHVPQGYAFGLWSWLEQRFQSTEQDSIGDLWEQFTSLVQRSGDTGDDSDESFDVYKARVDHVYGLLAHAKDKPSAGLYAHRLLWKLSPRYAPAVLALKASGKLKDASAIDWSEITVFINNHERSDKRAAVAESDHRAMAAYGGRRGNKSEQSGVNSRGGAPSGSGVQCYNCGEKGHIARFCEKPDRRTGRGGDKGESEHAAAARARSVSSDEEDGVRHYGLSALAARESDDESCEPDALGLRVSKRRGVLNAPRRTVSDEQECNGLDELSSWSSEPDALGSHGGKRTAWRTGGPPGGKMIGFGAGALSLDGDGARAHGERRVRGEGERAQGRLSGELEGGC